MSDLLAWVGENEASIRGWLATAITPVGAYFAFKAFRRGQENDEDRDAERRRSQAREVSAWVAEWFEDYDLEPFLQRLSFGRTRGRTWYWSVVIANQSSTPVYDLSARIFRNEDSGTVLDVVHLAQALPRRETLIHVDTNGESELSKIARLQLERGSDDEESETQSRPDDDASDLLVELTFRDANNVWWRRSARGVLEELPRSK